MQIFSNPLKLYDNKRFVYLPSFAILFAISLSLFPVIISYYIFFIINYILAILTIVEFNKILVLMNLKEKIHRFMFLIIISNGYFIYFQFYFNQTKYIVLLILLFSIRRELQFDMDEKVKELKYYVINYGLFVFAVGMAPYFIFLLLIYIFHNISFSELFKKENLKKYSIVIIMFVIQNFLFIIFPSLIFDFLDGFNHPQRRQRKLKLIYLREWVQISSSDIRFLSIMLTIALTIISLILILNNKLKIEEKFGYFCIAYVFVGIFAYSIIVSLVLFSFILLLFVPHLNQNSKGIEFVKNNITLLIGLFSILGISFMSSNFIVFQLISIKEEIPFVIFYNLRWIFLLSIMMSSLIKLYLEKKNY